MSQMLKQALITASPAIARPHKKPLLKTEYDRIEFDDCSLRHQKQLKGHCITNVANGFWFLTSACFRSCNPKLPSRPFLASNGFGYRAGKLNLIQPTKLFCGETSRE